MRKWLFCLILSILAGCMVGPNYKEPENTVSDVWNETMDDAISHEEPIIQWWKVFDEDLLTKYIEMAVDNNKNVLVAEANILQARALRQVAASKLFPQINADFNGSKTYFSKNGPLFVASTFTQGTSATTGLPFGIQIPQIQPLYNALFDASWEIDLFGKTRRNIQATEARIDSAVEQRNDTLISVMAEIARNYIEVRSNQKMGVLTERNIEILEQNAAIIKTSKEKGLLNDLNLETIEAELATARSVLPGIHAQIYKAIYTISILVGELPEKLVEELLPLKPLPKTPSMIAVGLRSDLLRRRPDVRRAERELAASTADIGVAVANFFPTITLSADGGLQSLKINNLFKWSSRTWSFGGDVNMPVFQGGRLVGNLHATQAAACAAAYTYQQTVLSAIQEAESSLVSYVDDLETSFELASAVEKNQVLVELTQKRYEIGLSPLPDLLSMEQQLVSAEQSLVNSETTALLDLISLYKSLGGGWQNVEDQDDDLIVLDDDFDAGMEY